MSSSAASSITRRSSAARGSIRRAWKTRSSRATRAPGAKRFGGPGPDGATAVAATPDGGLYVTGAFSQTATFESVPLASAGSTDIFLVKLVPPL